MNVSFKGIREVTSSFDYKKMDNSENKMIPIYLSVKLDNENGNDLDEFLKILPKNSMPKSQLAKLKQDGILNIVSSATYDKDSNSEARVYIQDTEVVDLDVLLKLTNLTDKIMERDTNPANNANFLFSNDLIKMPSALMNVMSKNAKTNEEGKAALKQSVDPEYNKLCANLLKSQLLSVISEFLTTVNGFIDMVKGQ